jgi:NAD dependent epimerase/dehydratase family enzyme
MAELLLASDRMLPQRLLDAGFRFRHPTLERALAAIFGRNA